MQKSSIQSISLVTFLLWAHAHAIAQEYTYDGNGNLPGDTNKQISSIRISLF